MVTAKDVTEDDRRRLNGFVKTILRKGAYHRNELLLAVREQVKACLQLAGARPHRAKPCRKFSWSKTTR